MNKVWIRLFHRKECWILTKDEHAVKWWLPFSSKWCIISLVNLYDVVHFGENECRVRAEALAEAVYKEGTGNWNEKKLYWKQRSRNIGRNTGIPKSVWFIGAGRSSCPAKRTDRPWKRPNPPAGLRPQGVLKDESDKIVFIQKRGGKLNATRVFKDCQ